MSGSSAHQSLWLRFNSGIWKLLHGLRLNVISRVSARGRTMYVKARNSFGRGILPMANLFLRVIHAPSRFHEDMKTWQRWEVKYFEMLNRPYRAAAVGGSVLIEDALPGKSLWDHLKEGTLTLRMVRAAGRELRRAHSFWSEEHHGGWSHGDAALCNFIYDSKADRARLIDFELVHEAKLGEVERQADDLRNFLLDMVGEISSKQWMMYSLCFLRAYDHAVVTEVLCERLVPGRGLALVWWKIRTSFTDSRLVIGRLEKLRRAVRRGAARRSRGGSWGGRSGGLRSIPRR
jgi:hypothetical protein